MAARVSDPPCYPLFLSLSLSLSPSPPLSHTPFDLQQAAGVGVGTFYGACQVAWYPDPIVSSAKRFGDTVHRHSAVDHSDFRAVMRAVARPATLFAASAGAYAATECVAGSVRDRDDSWNSMIGGAMAGAVIGSTTGRFDIMTACAVGTGLLLFAVDFSGPDTVWDKDALNHKMHGVLPEQHRESEELAALKEKYPKFKDL